MKTKTLLELLTLSSSLYYFAKDSHLIDRFNELAEKGKENINKAASDPIVNEDGNELEFIDKLILKTSQVKDELEQKIEEMVITFYKKVNIAHVDEIKALNEKLEKADMAIALLEARLNKLENNK
ncbi:hypothetical protein C7447_103384 [Tenacibaculum adriaticum]|uniref:Uncharacterized protein n=1 Tax=Tenacibaculum adriaticum TaxID=413713 RepID=A0A5S5DQI7_9FLAO|nr:hypothetical protein [Tenacibaculum adriaticum]TYP98213.1 hypothetical protein C7447_103384 [Tenacibaculum adriaticum]